MIIFDSGTKSTTTNSVQKSEICRVFCCDAEEDAGAELTVPAKEDPAVSALVLFLITAGKNYCVIYMNQSTFNLYFNRNFEKNNVLLFDIL